MSEKKKNEKERNESKQKETDEETRLLKERKIRVKERKKGDKDK